jgi:putative oxidoreductase
VVDRCLTSEAAFTYEAGQREADTRSVASPTGTHLYQGARVTTQSLQPVDNDVRGLSKGSHVSQAPDHSYTTPGEHRMRMHLVAPPPTVASESLPELDRAREIGGTAEAMAHRWLVAHSIMLLRVSLGAVFLAFGALKIFPGVSPAEDLVTATTHALTFGLVPGPVALLTVAVLECLVGILLISGRHLRAAICLMALLMVGILSPTVLFAPRLFSGPHHAPTLEGQYVLKDVVLVAATLVLAATLGGGRLRDADDPGSDSGSRECR